MNIGSGTSLVAVLKKKMLDTKEEVEKVKENIQDMSRIIQIEVEQKENALVEINKLEEKLAFLDEDLAKKREMIKFHPQPRTVRQRVENCQLLCQFNSEYQDDVFDHISPIKMGASLLSISLSDSEDNLSVISSSSTGPLLTWPVPRYSTPTKPNTQASKLTSFQHQAFIHKRIKEKKKMLDSTGNEKRRRCSRKRVIRGRSSMDKKFKKLQQVIAVSAVEQSSYSEVVGEEMESYFSDVGE